MATTSDQRSIVLTGFMGTGKTTVGKLVAERLERPFIDMDVLIVERAGMPIPQVFRTQGETAFRALESQVCRELAAQSGLVIATGGGALVNPDNRSVMLASCVVVCLSAEVDTLQARLEPEIAGRPLLAGDWQGLLQRRLSAYGEIPHQIDTTGKMPEHVAEEIIALWRQFA